MEGSSGREGSVGGRLEQAQRFWDGSAEWDVHRAIYDSDEVRDPATREKAFEEAGLSDARRLLPYVAPDMRVVELGCGIGRVMRPLAPHCRELVGVDISEEMLRRSKAYLKGISNARTVKTDGANLPTVEDGTVGFLYAVLCFIHVDKRNAYRYFREIARVLEPGGLAYLQFENILSHGGLEEFIRVVDLPTEYPLEFYSLDELEVLLGSVGLELVTSYPWNQFLNLTVVKGSAEEWMRETREGVAVADHGIHGVFSGPQVDLAGSGSIEARIRSGLARDRGFTAHAILSFASGEVFAAAGVVDVRAGAEETLRFDFDGAQGRFNIRIGDRPARLSSSDRVEPTGGELELCLALCPPGFRPEDLPERFPGLCASLPRTAGPGSGA